MRSPLPVKRGDSSGSHSRGIGLFPEGRGCPAGSGWKPLKPTDTSWAKGPVRVGLLSTDTSSEPSLVNFDDDTLETR